MSGKTAKVISVVQEKGGATKTSTSINLGMALNELGYKCIIGDMDREKPDSMRWAEGGDAKLADYVCLIAQDNPRDRVAALKKQCDFLILDTPPNLDGAALKGALLSDLVIIPCSPSVLDQTSLVKASEVAMFAQKPYLFLASKVRKNTIGTRDLLNELNSSGQHFKTCITNSVNVEGAAGSGMWVGDFKPDSDSHHQFLDLAKEVVDVFEGSKLSNTQMTEEV